MPGWVNRLSGPSSSSCMNRGPGQYSAGPDYLQSSRKVRISARFNFAGSYAE